MLNIEVLGGWRYGECHDTGRRMRSRRAAPFDRSDLQGPRPLSRLPVHQWRFTQLVSVRAARLLQLHEPGAEAACRPRSRTRRDPQNLLGMLYAYGRVPASRVAAVLKAGMLAAPRLFGTPQTAIFTMDTRPSSRSAPGYRPAGDCRNVEEPPGSDRFGAGNKSPPTRSAAPSRARGRMAAAQPSRWRCSSAVFRDRHRRVDTERRLRSSGSSPVAGRVR
jgi:hypothetical protein